MSNNNNNAQEKQKKIEETIQSIQNFYQVSDHTKLISIILNRKESQHFFTRERLTMSDLFQMQDDEPSKIAIFAKKYTYQNLIDKFRNPKSFRNQMLVAILKNKMRNNLIESNETRKRVWMLVSGALFAMKNNKGFYQCLTEYHNYPKYYERCINMDVIRTVKNIDNKEEKCKYLSNVLINFSRRKSFLGYCQGMNSIVFFLLNMGFSQEESFWILSQIIDTLIPSDYYTSMMGVICDQQIFLQMLAVLKPKICKKFEEVGLDSSVLCIQWFVCLFTASLPFKVPIFVNEVSKNSMGSTSNRRHLNPSQDRHHNSFLSVEVYSRSTLILYMSLNLDEIIMIIEKKSKEMQLQEQQFNKQFDKIYIDAHGLSVTRDIHRFVHLKSKIREKSNRSTKHQYQCNLDWPICTHAIRQCRDKREDMEVWVYRQEKSPKIIHDYLDSHPKLSKNQLKKQSLKNVKPSEIMIGRMEHICCNSEKKDDPQSKKSKNQALFKSIMLPHQSEKEIENIRKIFQNSERREEEETEKSQTIDFYASFIKNNQQILEMLHTQEKQ